MKNTTIARHIVNKIVDDISDRKGLRQEWEQIDIDTINEIRIAWKVIIMEELKHVEMARRKTKRG